MVIAVSASMSSAVTSPGPVAARRMVLGSSLSSFTMRSLDVEDDVGDVFHDAGEVT
jgi:hypothetical protein